MDKPPSTGSTTPVIKDASGEHRKAMAWATSADVPVRRTGYCSSKTRKPSSLPSQDLFEAGRANIRDIVESQDDLVRAQNSLSRTLIDYIEARLGFLVAIEGLDVDDSGMWVEIHGEDRIADASQ